MLEHIDKLVYNSNIFKNLFFQGIFDFKGLFISFTRWKSKDDYQKIKKHFYKNRNINQFKSTRMKHDV